MGSLGSHSVLPSFYEVWEFVSLGCGCFEWADHCGNARLTPLFGLVWLWSSQVLLIQTRSWVQDLISHQEARLSIQGPAATVNAKCYTKGSHEIAPAAPNWSRRTVFFLNSLNYCNIRCNDLSLSTADAGKENGELIVTKKNKRLGTQDRKA